MMRPDVTDARPSLEPATAQNRGVLAGTAVIPAARAAHLTSELYERNVKRRLHHAPFALQQERACDADVLRVAVVRCDGDRLLLGSQRGSELLSEDLHHDRLRHRAPVDLDVPAERVDEIPPRDPRHGAVNHVIRDDIASASVPPRSYVARNGVAIMQGYVVLRNYD